MTTEQRAEESWTIRRVLSWTQQRFRDAGLPSPRLDAELLLSHGLGRPRVGLYTHFDQPLDKAELERFRLLIRKRLAGTPVAYLTGKKEFYSLPLQVTEAVLIPRPETEGLVDAALALLPPAAGQQPATAETQAAIEQQVAATPGVELTIHYEELLEPPELPEESPTEAASAEAAPAAAATPAPSPPAAAPQAAAAPTATAADIGTGSGAVALALQKTRPDVRVLAVDCSEAALAVAQGNAAQLGLPVEFFLGDLLAPLPRGLDLIVSNPPYIRSAEIARLAAEVRSEPHLALDGGPDGLVVLRRLIAQAPAHLCRGGAIALEIGEEQGAAVSRLLSEHGFTEVRVHDDLAGLPRVVTGRLA